LIQAAQGADANAAVLDLSQVSLYRHTGDVMNNPAELALVYKAIKSGVTGCYEWDDREADRLRGETSLQGLTPEHIRARLHDFVVQGGTIQQVPERRPEYSHRSFYYKTVIPEPGFKHGLFVEMELTDDDAELPCVTLLNAHAQAK
jgi:hypothetical protein